VSVGDSQTPYGVMLQYDGDGLLRASIAKWHHSYSQFSVFQLRPSFPDVLFKLLGDIDCFCTTFLPDQLAMWILV